MNSEALKFKSHELYAESVSRALALSAAFHLLLVVATALGLHFRWLNPGLMQRLRFPDQKRFGSLARKATATAPEVPLVLVQIHPHHATSEASKAAKPMPDKGTPPASVAKVAHPKVEALSAPLVPPTTKPAPPAQVVQPQAPPQIPPAPELAPKKAIDPQNKIIPPALDSDSARPLGHESKTSALTDLKPLPQPIPADKPGLKRSKADILSAGNLAPAAAATEVVAPAPRRPTIEVDLKGTPFAGYDSSLITAVQKRWYQLLDERRLSRENVGRVVVEFRLKSDGQVSELNIARREVDFIPAWVCQRAIADAAPFAPWPGDMRRTIKTAYRSVRFTFVY